MTPLRRVAARPGGRLARRLFLLFVLAALLPLALSDGLSQVAVTQLAQKLDLQRREQTTRQVSRQVYDRLLAGRTLIGSLPTTLAGVEAARPGSLVGEGQVFRQLVALGPDGRLAWTDGAASAVLPPPALPPSPANGREADPAPPVQLLPVAVPGAPPQWWLVQSPGSALRWMAELAPSHLWAPVVEAGDDGAWLVRDAAGTAVFTTRGGDYPPAWPLPEAGAAPPESVDTRARLFLAGAFHAGDWQFVQRSPRPVVHWQGMPLGAWLAGVALATLLAIAWLARWQIRRALAPLEDLNAGTQRLAAGDDRTRVAVVRNDEIGRLAEAFNHMAERIEAQFDALAGLTAIDRQILQGAPIEALVEQVLLRLRSDCEGTPACIVWLDGPTRLRRAWLEAPAHADDGALLTDGLALDEPGRAAFERLARGQDAAEPSPAAPGTAVSRAASPQHVAGHALGAWLPPAWRGQPLTALPLGTGAGPAALVVLRLAAPAPAAVLQRARDLRDRLGVALAAREREAELIHRARHDSLTGLLNRYGLQLQLDAACAGEAPHFALCLIDLDHFKDVNDSRGHAAGDALLGEASRRLQAVAPAGAVVARQGGDEFAVLLPGADGARAQAFGSAAVEALARPFALDDGEHTLGASIGIALHPASGPEPTEPLQPAALPEELMRRADIALYAAKAEGRGRHRLFEPTLDLLARDRVQRIAELRRGIAAGEFVVHYQPRVAARDGRIRSAEALVRWQHPVHGLLFPGAFIALAESAGLIEALGSAVLATTCAQLAAWRARGLTIDRVSVNVSPQQLASGRLPGEVRRLLDQHRLPGRMLELEVTESLLVGDARSATAQLTELRQWGVTVALDDFGTGYSSMATLRQLPIDVMKVDRAFVTDVCEDQGARAVTSAIIALARTMQLHLVAEGIERDDQAAMLGGMGCDELQGFLFSRALPAEAFERLPGLAWAAPQAQAEVAEAG